MIIMRSSLRSVCVFVVVVIRFHFLTFGLLRTMLMIPMLSRLQQTQIALKSPAVYTILFRFHCAAALDLFPKYSPESIRIYYSRNSIKSGRQDSFVSGIGGSSRVAKAAAMFSETRNVLIARHVKFSRHANERSTEIRWIFSTFCW